MTPSNPLSVFNLPRRSLLIQLLGVYLLFVALVLGIDYQVNQVAQQQVRSQVQTTDLALAQEIALDTNAELQGDEVSLTQLSRLPAVRQGNVGAMKNTFQAFKVARREFDLIYWLSPRGTLQVSVPTDIRTLGADFSNQEAFQRARTERGTPRPIVQDGIVDLTTFHAVLTLAIPVRNSARKLVGILATNLRLDDLNQSFQPVVASQRQQRQHLVISILDAQGRLIGTDQRERLLQPALSDLPGAAAALQGHNATRQGADPQGQQWLYSSVPIHSVGWAVVVQRSASDALAVVTNFQRWITIAAGIFALGGLLFWFELLFRVVRPLQLLARRHAALPSAGSSPVLQAPVLTERADEVGLLARSLCRLEDDVVTRLAELHTLLETSNAVVNSLDPSAVGRTIIREVQRLVDIQAAAVLVPDEQGVLRVLVSVGRDEWHDQASTVRPDDFERPAALALHDGRPVQMIAGTDEPFPPLSYAAGFRAVLAVPIISRHVGGVVLSVHRTQPQPFTEQEIELLLTFANYATLAWEHAVLYERSDERLREVARENEQLYRAATAEKQTLAAIMRSMNDGLILTGDDGRVLYSNPGASAITGMSGMTLEGSHIDRIHEALRTLSRDAEAYDRQFSQVRGGERLTWLLETEAGGRYRAISLRLFDVRDETDEIIGHGLLLRDVTRERELDQFKTTLLGAVGHELRTPLAVIKGYASTLLQDDVVWSAADQHYFLQTISSEADRLAQLVTNLLDLSRLEAGLLLLHPAPYRVEDLVTNAVRRLHVPIPRLQVEIPGHLPPVDVDGARVEIVLHNLLANALAYGNGEVAVSAQQQDGMVVVQVADNGPGIDQAELPHIFERFYRASHGSQRRSAGTGLGLAISKAFVEAHGGSIWAESSAGHTVISLSLPAGSVEDTDSSLMVERVAQPSGHGTSGGAA